MVFVVSIGARASAGARRRYPTPMANNTPTLDRGDTSYKYDLLSIADRPSRGENIVVCVARGKTSAARSALALSGPNGP
jgi:hypothetical protein